jgi:hypothetical protein
MTGLTRRGLLAGAAAAAAAPAVLEEACRSVADLPAVAPPVAARTGSMVWMTPDGIYAGIYSAEVSKVFREMVAR